MPTLQRRHFILGGLGGLGVLIVGWASLPQRSRLFPRHELPVAPGEVALNGWVKVASDGTVTLVMSQTEMGQGAHTGLAMLLAEEMDADWSRIRLEQAGDDPIYNNQVAVLDSLPFQPEDHGVLKRSSRHLLGKLVREIPGLSGTGGSSSMMDQWLPVRQAGAVARAQLIAAAAARWAVPAAQCRAEQGWVLHGPDRRASFGELAAQAAKSPLPERVPLKEARQFALIGRPVPRIDAAAKVDGSASFAMDARPTGLLYAAIRLCPTLAGSVRRIDSVAAQALPGVRRVVRLEPVSASLVGTGSTSGGVAVVAERAHQALTALAALTVEWDPGAAAAWSTPDVEAALRHALENRSGRVHFERGDVGQALRTAARTLAADYRVPMLAHATMEPMNCTALVRAGGTATVWAPTQAPGMARAAIAKALGIRPARVELIVPYLGGGFGRRYVHDVPVQAALVAREMAGQPVQLLWPRAEDMTHDFYRPPVQARLDAALDAQGRLVGWQIRAAGPGMGTPQFLQGALLQGAFDTGYSVPHARMAYAPVDLPLPFGIWRSVAHSQNAFFVECFIDEAAAAAARDPIAFRLALLEGEPRMRRVLERAADLSDWQHPAAPAADGAPIGRGVALHRSFGSVVAQVAEVSLGPQREIRVHRVVCVLDCGTAVNPNLIRQQLEGGLIFGLSAALHGEITLEHGIVQQRNFDGYPVLRMSECPRIETDILASEAPPAGVGEVATPPIAPAIANALFALTGQRLRALPLRLS